MIYNRTVNFKTPFVDVSVCGVGGGYLFVSVFCLWVNFVQIFQVDIIVVSFCIRGTDYNGSH